MSIDPKISLLFSPLTSLPRIASKTAAHYARLECRSILDLLFYFPNGYIDRRSSTPLSRVKHGEIVTHIVQVLDITFPDKKHSRSPVKIKCKNATGFIDIVYFRGRAESIDRIYRIGESVLISGKIEKLGHFTQMSHPDIVTLPTAFEKVARLEAVYPLTYGLTSRAISQHFLAAFKQLPALQEWLPAEIVEHYKWPSWQEALMQMHDPNLPKIGRTRLAFEEILAEQILIRRARAKMHINRKEHYEFNGELQKAFIGLLPFTLTEAQYKVIEEINQDQRSSKCMARIVQGDVGSGKTVVAVAAMLNVIECKRQAVLMVPTEILARQHYAKIQPWCEALNIRTALLVGKDKKAAKNIELSKIESGEAQLIIGTHTLFQDNVIFHDLGIVVIDEQHKFGVEQRISLMQKGQNPDFLMLSATPIPRTLSMILYGDLDVSVIDQKPANRKEILTSIISHDKILELMEKLPKALSDGEKIYWICPVIEESEKKNLQGVLARYEELTAILGAEVGIIHGQVPLRHREVIMEEFIEGKIKVLIATTVIEVGIDVPDATTIIIEHAEQFGLAQLHQLRGRVGRGDRQSKCILIYKHPVSQATRHRLGVMRASNDGFYIAQKDLEIRGGGSMFGKNQSGLPAFKVFDIAQDYEMLHLAHKMSEAIFSADPELSSEYKGLNTMIRIYKELWMELV